MARLVSLVIAHDLLLVQFYLYRYRKEDRRITVNFFLLPSIFVYLLGSLVFEQEKN